VLIRKDNRYLISTVYLDMREDCWAIAVAYNPSRNPGLHGQENILEVRYSYENRRGNTVTIFRSDTAEESAITAGPFSDPDTFAQYAINHERDLINRLA
jgi:hypothetical protein